MDFLKKNLFLKNSVLLIIIFLIMGGIHYALTPFLHQWMGPWFFLLLPGVLLFATWLVIFLSLERPLAKIFQEMKALLTGHPYKKIFTPRLDEVGVLAHFFNEVTKNLERISVDLAEGKRMSQEFSIASDIQRKILPKGMPTVPGVTIFGNMRPASEVGGDSFDIIMTPLGNTLVYVGDVTGHGLPAALIMVMVNTLIRTFAEIYPSGYDILVHTNRLLKQRIEPRRFMTCVLLRWNPKEQKLYYTGAGHEHLLIFHKRESRCEVKQTGGIALGMVQDISHIIREEPIELEKGDFVVLYSDGIIEAKNMQGAMFGLERLKKAVEQYAASSRPEGLFTNISRNFGSFVNDQLQEDDITLIAVQRD